MIGALYIYGINFYYLTFVAIRENKKKPNATPNIDNWPKVTIQLPIYNEMYVAQRLINAVVAVDYPSEQLEIQVLDDSTDETTKIVAEIVIFWQIKNVNIKHLHRTNREGYKAGALKEGLKTAEGEFIAFFDADFLPTKDFLRKTIPHFQNPKIGFVQTRWEHVNRNYSLLTRLQSLAIDAHFMIEQFGRSKSGIWFNFNGTAGVWRKKTILDAGGWQATTLTEDLDLSYRAFLKGWQAKYLRHVGVPAELPVTINAFRQQQHRWARGSLECAQLLLPKIWQSNSPARIKIGSTLHLTGYVVHLLLFALCLLYPFIIFFSIQYPSLISLFGIALILNITAFAPTLFFIVAQRQLGRSWIRLLPLTLFISAFGSGMMLNTLRAALQVIRGNETSFERTPKFGITEKTQRWRNKNYQLKFDKIAIWEIIIGILNFNTVHLSIKYGHWFIGFYSLLFGTGLFFTSFYTIYQAINFGSKTKEAPLSDTQESYDH